jgi:hypothetical protein
MAVSLIDMVRETMSSPRGGRPVCFVCKRAVSRNDDQLRLRGGVVVHKSCATYRQRLS